MTNPTPTPGTRVRFIRQWVDPALIVVDVGELGTFTRVGRDGDWWVKLDRHDPCLDEWGNELQMWDWSPDEGPQSHPASYLKVMPGTPKLLFAWDELANEVKERDPDELRECNQEGGWEYDGSLPNGVAVLRTDRHVALECWADTIEQAREMFSVRPEYEAMQAG